MNRPPGMIAAILLNVVMIVAYWFNFTFMWNQPEIGVKIATVILGLVVHVPLPFLIYLLLKGLGYISAVKPASKRRKKK